MRRRRRAVELDGQAAYAVLAGAVGEMRSTVVTCDVALKYDVVLRKIALPPPPPTPHSPATSH